MTEFELFQALRTLYPPREYALLPQAANATGAGVFRHCDALALGLWPSRGLHLSGFEIKTYRGDWLREKKNPAKAEQIAQYCNYWWIVAAAASVTADELPQPWGLLAWDDKKHGLVKLKAATFSEAIKPLDLHFIAAMLRKAQEVVTPDAVITEARAAGLKEGRIERDALAKHDLEDYAKLKAQCREFEEASGVKISRNGWITGKQIGEAVNQVINGTVMREREALREIAERLLQDLNA